MKETALFRRNIYIVSAVISCAAALFVTSQLRAGVFLAVFLAAVAVNVIRSGAQPLPERRVLRWMWIGLAAATSVFFSHRFRSKLLELGVGGQNVFPLLAGSVILAIPMLYFFLCTYARLLRCSAPRGDAPAHPERSRLTAGEALFLFFTAAAVITVCSKSSPLYPFNDWVDANCFFTVGKSMVHGKVLYRDIYEQKGVLLYALHALAYLISKRTFFGVWLLEIAAAYFFLRFAYQTARLFVSRRCLLLMPLLAGILYSMPSFCHGDSAEELCLPFLMYAMYLGARSLHTGEELRRRDWFGIGVTSGCVLWIKFSLLGFYLGWAIPLVIGMLRKKRWRSLGNTAAFLILGVGTATLPVLGYFAVHGAIKNLWQAYFYNNIFLYNRADGSILSLLWLNIGDGYVYSSLLYMSILFGLVFLLGQGNRSLAWQFLLSLGFLILSSMNRAFPMNYYTFALSVFSVYLLPLLDGLLPEKALHGRLVGAVSVVLSAAVVLCCCENLYLLSWQKKDMPQFIFAETLSRYEDPTLLNYGFLDGGFYTVSGIVPSEKYFCTLNILLEEMTREQNECLQAGRVDFVVTREQELDLPRYRCVNMAEMPFEGWNWTYRLYMRNDLSE